MFKRSNLAGGIVPNFPIIQSIVEMERQVSELYGALEAAGCTVEQECGAMRITVPHGVDIQPIMDAHKHMLTR